MTTHDKDKIIAAAKEAGCLHAQRDEGYRVYDSQLEAIYAIAHEDGRQADKADAERYRFLRDNSAYVGVNPHSKTCLWVLRGIREIDGAGFDEAVDGAIRARGDSK